PAAGPARGRPRRVDVDGGDGLGRPVPRPGALSVVTAGLVARGTTLMRSGLIRTAMGLYAIQASSWLVPLATIFFLARRLGPEHWGLLMFMQGAAAYVIFFVCYCCSYSATREVARNRGDPDALAGPPAGGL